MKYYETLYIAHPILETGRLKDTIENIQKLVKKNEKNTILCTEVWGKKKLAYPIEKQKYGTYILEQYSGDGHMIDDVNKEMEHNVNVLAYMTVEISKEEIREQKLDIESQIHGNVSKDKEYDNQNVRKSIENKKLEKTKEASATKEVPERTSDVEEASKEGEAVEK